MLVMLVICHSAITRHVSRIDAHQRHAAIADIIHYPRRAVRYGGANIAITLSRHGCVCVFVCVCV